jgi:hypothetical protein
VRPRPESGPFYDLGHQADTQGRCGRNPFVITYQGNAQRFTQAYPAHETNGL